MDEFVEYIEFRTGLRDVGFVVFKVTTLHSFLNTVLPHFMFLYSLRIIIITI